ncbi:hypothetical protein AC249_AIPGENE17084 [Exaiptasia diaphana]|nr:hypothetical protein AC249_AIPGENE17084 [Exaiptasia diaphana]
MLENVKAMWRDWVACPRLNPKGCNKVCLMNNKVVVKQVQEQLQNGQTDPQTIANKISMSKSVDEIQEMIAILSKDPSIKALPDAVQTEICNFREEFKLTFDTASRVLNKVGRPRKVTKEEYENQICPPPKSRDIVSS